MCRQCDVTAATSACSSCLINCECRQAESAARVAAVHAAVRTASAQAVHAELVSMHSAAQGEATALNEAEITYLTTKVQSLAEGMARLSFHASRCAQLLIKQQLRYGTLECACSHVTVYDSMADMGDEDVRQALAQGHMNLLSLQASHNDNQELLVNEQHQQECWCHKSPSTDTLYRYVTCSWPITLCMLWHCQ